MVNIFFHILILFLSTSLCFSITRKYYIYYSEKNSSFFISEHQIKNYFLASAKYSNAFENDGWDRLYLNTNKNIKDNNLTSYASGYLEGYITQKRIFNHWQNVNAFTWKNGKMPEYVKSYFRDNQKYI